MDDQFARLMLRSLVWLPERGMGYYPVSEADAPYDADYFAKYQGYAATEMGKSITAARVALVDKHVGDAPVLDIGIGCGNFIEARHLASDGFARTDGFDVNPVGVAWLRERARFVDWADVQHLENVSLWDVLEHLPEPHALLEKVRGYVFTSLPIFRDGAHVLASKHYRRDEHYWYWTDDGIRRWFDGYGFDCVDSSRVETRLGREDIGTYAFARR